MKRVVIVGGGVIGLWCAVRLRQGGAQVTLVESEPEHPTPFGPSASAAAAGMLAPIPDEPSAHDALALASFDLWKQRRQGAQWADGVRFDGAVIVSRDAADAEALRANAARLGRKAAALSQAQVRKVLPFTAKLEHATFVADEGVADPVRVMTGLAMQARALGALVDYDTEIANITVSAALTHEGRIYEADVVVLAPGVWASRRFVGAAPALAHVRSAKGQLAQVILPGPLPATMRTPDIYVAQRREDIVLGSTLEYDRYDRRADPALTEAMLAKANALLSGEVRAGEKTWAGIRPMSPDGWPMIGLSGDVLIAAGHSRNGWLLAPITAEIISAYVFGGEIAPEWAALSPQRFETT